MPTDVEAVDVALELGADVEPRGSVTFPVNGPADPADVVTSAAVDVDLTDFVLKEVLNSNP